MTPFGWSRVLCVRWLRGANRELADRGRTGISSVAIRRWRWPSGAGPDEHGVQSGAPGAGQRAVEDADRRAHLVRVCRAVRGCAGPERWCCGLSGGSGSFHPRARLGGLRRRVARRCHTRHRSWRTPGAKRGGPTCGPPPRRRCPPRSPCRRLGCSWRDSGGVVAALGASAVHAACRAGPGVRAVRLAVPGLVAWRAPPVVQHEHLREPRESQPPPPRGLAREPRSSRTVTAPAPRPAVTSRSARPGGRRRGE
jgi:hypothetical protein